MELFLLFSLALTFVAFLSIVLAEPPTPLTSGTEADLRLGMLLPITSAQTEHGIGIPGSALDNEQAPAAAVVTAEEFQAMF